MVEVSERGIKDEELELDLGLSIGGGGSRRSEESNLNGVDPSHGEIQTVAVERSTSTAVGLSSDPQTKLEVQALRRQEAKRKRKEKRSRGGGGRSEPQEVGEQQSSPPARKKEKSSEPTTNSNNSSILLSQGSENSANVNLNLSNGETERYPVQPVQYPYVAPVQFVPYTNGRAYPCVMPCWAPSSGSGFRPFLANQNLGNNGWCNNSEQNDAGGGGKVVKTASLSNGSPICSTSTISEHYSTASHEGDGSSDTRSQSSLFNGAIAKELKAQSDHTATSHPIESKAQPNEKSAQPAEPAPKPVSLTEDCPPTITTTLKETEMEPPKTHGQNSERTEKIPSMPYVSTTGNGPNGTTIHGFLYRYSKSEISIVCVCHGSTFSPAEFVQHAGGTDVTQPLRHITVIPSAFG